MHVANLKWNCLSTSSMYDINISFTHSPIVCRSPLHCCLIISSSLVSSCIISLTVEWISANRSLVIFSSSILNHVSWEVKSASAASTALTVQWGGGGGSVYRWYETSAAILQVQLIHSTTHQAFLSTLLLFWKPHLAVILADILSLLSESHGSPLEVA